MVSARYTHDGARTVVKKDIIRNPDLYLMSRQGMDTVIARIHAQFF